MESEVVLKCEGNNNEGARNVRDVRTTGFSVEGSYPTPHIHEQKTTSNYI